MDRKPSQRLAQRETATDRLIRAYREQGDVRARDRVVQIYVPLVDTFARRYETAGIRHAELMRVGSAALADAIDAYVPRRGDEFIGFALPVIVDRIAATATAQPANEQHGTHGRAIDLRDERLQLASGFGALLPSEREVFQMRFIDDLSGGETATRLGMSEEELARRTRTALAKLRRKLEQRGSGRPLAVTDGDTLEASAEPARDAKESHSGRLLLRMSPSLHTKLADAAQRDEVSLNHFINDALSETVVAQREENGGHARSDRRAASRPRWLAAAIAANIVVLAIAGVVGVILLLAALQGA